MIVKQTREQKIHAEITKLIEVLEPIAKKYKRISMAKDAMRAIDWNVYTSDSHGGATSCSVYIRNGGSTEFVQVYEYGKQYATLSDLVAMLKDQLPRYRDSEPTIYISPLCKFIDSAVGADVECTVEDFIQRKVLTIDALTRAIEFVRRLDDCKDSRHDQFDAPKQNED